MPDKVMYSHLCGACDYVWWSSQEDEDCQNCLEPNIGSAVTREPVAPQKNI